MPPHIRPVTLGLGYSAKPLPLLEGLPAVWWERVCGEGQGLSQVQHGSRANREEPFVLQKALGSLGQALQAQELPPPPANQVTSPVPDFKVTQEVEREFVPSTSVTCSPAAEGEIPVVSGLCGCLDLPGEGWGELELKKQEDRTTHRGKSGLV